MDEKEEIAYERNEINNKKVNVNIEDDDPDSGLVEDAFDVLPDENTLAFDYELELDLSDGNFSRCSTATTEDFSDLLELDTSLADLDDNVFISDSVQTKSFLLPHIVEDEGQINSSLNQNQKINEKINDVSLKVSALQKAQDESINKGSNNTVEYSNGKLKSFTKEQARQWRRKRILNTFEKSNFSQYGEEINDKTAQIPTQLKPLLPLPKTLKPLKDKSLLQKNEPDVKGKINPAEKLANPLLGGEKLGTKTKRGPVPMKLRALPESFWKEPNTIHTSSLAGNNYSVLPPLFASEGKGSDNVTCIRPVTPPDDKKNSPRHSPRSKKKWVMTSPPDTDLLFSLFDHLENKVDEKLIVKRGRPKKSTAEKIPPPPSCSRVDDPCIVDDLATKLFPELTLHQKNGKEKGTTTSNYAMIRIGKGNHRLEFPAIQAKDNYPAILNELVTHM